MLWGVGRRVNAMREQVTSSQEVLLGSILRDSMPTRSALYDCRRVRELGTRNLTQPLSLRDPISVARSRTLGAATFMLGVVATRGEDVPGVKVVAGAMFLGGVSYGVREGGRHPRLHNAPYNSVSIPATRMSPAVPGDISFMMYAQLTRPSRSAKPSDPPSRRGRMTAPCAVYYKGQARSWGSS